MSPAKTFNACCNKVMHFLLIMAALAPTLLNGQTSNKYDAPGSAYTDTDPGTLKIEPVYKNTSRPDLKTNLVIYEKSSPDKGNDVNILEEGFEEDFPERFTPGASIPVRVSFKNFGSVDQLAFPLHYQVDAAAVVTGNFPGTLAAGATENMTFSQTWASSREGTFEFVAWTRLPGDEDPVNDGLPEPASIIVSRTRLQEIFFEDFESYPTGILGDAPETKWVRHASSRTGHVTTDWVKAGTKNFETASFTTSSEIDYALLDIAQRPDQLNLELWYSPDGFFAFDDYARIGLADVTEKATMIQKVSFKGLGFNIKYKTTSMASDINVYEQLVAGSGPAPSGTPVHTYIRAEFDFRNSETRFYIGPDENAALQSKVFLDNDINFNALFISGGLNPTFFDDIKITTITEPEYVNDAGAVAMDIPSQVNTGTSMPVGVIVQNFGTAAQSNIPVSYRIDNGAVVTEQLPGPLAPGASVKKTFSTAWIPPAQGNYTFNAWTSLPGDERTENDTLAMPASVEVLTGIENTSPVMSVIENQVVVAGETSVLTVNATDSDSDILTFSLTQNPGFLAITNTTQNFGAAMATIEIAPSFLQTGSYAASVQVSDNKGGVDSKNFSIEVATASKGSWSYQNPLQGTAEWRSVFFQNETTGLAVNSKGEITKSTDGGQTWMQVYKGDFSLQTMSFINSTTGWVAGIKGNSLQPAAPILKTTDSGTTWTVQSTPFANRILDIHFVNDQIGYAVGKTNEWRDIVIKTSNGGDSWEIIKTSETTSQEYRTLHFTDSHTGWVAGSDPGNPDILIKTTDGGTSWSVQHASINTGINDLYFVNALTGWAVAGKKVLKTIDGGENWTEKIMSTNNTLNAVYFLNSQQGWIAGEGSTTTLGIILFTNNGGESWQNQPTATATLFNVHLHDIYFVNADVGWAVGDWGTVFKTTNGGISWQNLSHITLGQMQAVSFIDNYTGWAGGILGTLLKTIDGGQHWVKAPIPNSYTIASMHFLDSKTGWVGQSAGSILKTVDGGTSWQQINTPANRTIQCIFFADAQTGYAAGGGSIGRFIMKSTDGGNTWTMQSLPEGAAIFGMNFIDKNTGWIAGMNGTVFSTTNGGETWVTQNTGRSDWLESVFFHDSSIGFIAGSEGLLQTTNGGSNYTFVEAGDGWIDDVVFLDQSNGFAVGARGSTLSKGIDGGGYVDLHGGSAKTWITNDGGLTWDETIPSVGNWMLDASFTDRNNGWAVGRYGLIAKYSNTLPIPDQPTGLMASCRQNNAITLAWTDNASNESGFEIFRSDGVSGNFQFLTSVDANTTTYEDTGLANETTYWYRIRAVNAIGASAKSLEAFAKVTTQTLPAVTTSSITEITFSSAKCGGNVTSDGGSQVTAKGVVWGTSLNPSMQNNSGFTSDGTGTGTFVSTLSGLDQLSAYHVRAYATNSIGTAYGSDISFTTLPQVFSINALANPESGGTVSGGGSYIFGQEASLTATASSNFNFINWTENNTPVHSLSTYSFQVFSDRTLVANFQNVTSVGQLDIKTGFRVFPNPATGEISIENLENDSGMTVVSLMNPAGQLVITWNCFLAQGEKLTFGCGGISPGLYYLRIRLNKHEHIEKLVVADH